MADWIKMRSGLLTNPKVIRMSRLLATSTSFINWWTRGTTVKCDASVYEICDVTVVTRVTVGSLLSLWSAVNGSASKDNFVKGITLFEVDEMSGVPGFGDALVTVGWAEVRHDGIIFPNFEEHNIVENGRASGPKTGAQRTKEWRDRQSSQNVTGNVTCDGEENVSSDVTVTPREEKKREDKNKRSTRFDAQAHLESWGAGKELARDWLALRKDKKLTPTETALNGVKAEADKAGMSMDDVLRTCCERGWGGFKADWLDQSNSGRRVNGHSDSIFG